MIHFYLELEEERAFGSSLCHSLEEVIWMSLNVDLRLSQMCLTFPLNALFKVKINYIYSPYANTSGEAEECNEIFNIKLKLVQCFYWFYLPAHFILETGRHCIYDLIM